MSLSLLPLASLTCSISWIVEETSVRGGGGAVNCLGQRHNEEAWQGPYIVSHRHKTEPMGRIDKQDKQASIFRKLLRNMVDWEKKR